MAGGALSQLTASKEGSSGTVRNWHPLTGGADVNAGEYYGKNSGRYFSSGSNEMKVPCHAYGQGRASSFGAVHDDWKMTGPNLAPYPGSSGMMTGGAKRKGRKQTKKAGSKKVVKGRKSKKVTSKRGGGGELMLNFNGNVITLTKSYFDTDEGKIFLENLKTISSNPKFKNTNTNNNKRVKVDIYTQIENAIYKLLESTNTTIDIPQINIPTEEIFKEVEALKNKVCCFTIQYIDSNPEEENTSLTKEEEKELAATSLPYKLTICTNDYNKLLKYKVNLTCAKNKYSNMMDSIKKNIDEEQKKYVINTVNKYIDLYVDVLRKVENVGQSIQSETYITNNYGIYSKVATPLWEILTS